MMQNEMYYCAHARACVCVRCSICVAITVVDCKLMRYCVLLRVLPASHGSAV